MNQKLSDDMDLVGNLSRTKQVGIFIIVLSIMMFFVVLSFTQRLTELNMILHENCPLDPSVCPMLKTPEQAIYGFIIVFLITGTGVYLLLIDKKEEKLERERLEKFKEATERLEGDELKIYETLLSSDGVMFQSNLVEKSGLTKVKVTRILDKLEVKGLVERKRRGLSNVVVLKHR